MSFLKCLVLYNFCTWVKHLKIQIIVLASNFNKIKVILISKTSQIPNVFDFQKAFQELKSVNVT